MSGGNGQDVPMGKTGLPIVLLILVVGAAIHVRPL